MFYKSIKFEIERERTSINVWFWQPLLIALLFIIVFISHQQGIYALYSLVFIFFPILFTYYIYTNFLKAKNPILVEINRSRLAINEPGNPFSRSINIPISEIERVFTKRKNMVRIRKTSFLYATKNGQRIKLIGTRSFWYGKVTNENLQELLFYLQQQNPDLLIDESLNE